MSEKLTPAKWIRFVGGTLGLLFLPAMIELQWIKASESGGGDSILPCLLIGIACVWITPFGTLGKALFTLAYLFVMGAILFYLGFAAMCGFHHSCL